MDGNFTRSLDPSLRCKLLAPENLADQCVRLSYSIAEKGDMSPCAHILYLESFSWTLKTDLQTWNGHVLPHIFVKIIKFYLCLKCQMFWWLSGDLQGMAVERHEFESWSGPFFSFLFFFQTFFIFFDIHYVNLKKKYQATSVYLVFTGWLTGAFDLVIGEEVICLNMMSYIAVLCIQCSTCKLPRGTILVIQSRTVLQYVSCGIIYDQ